MAAALPALLSAAAPIAVEVVKNLIPKNEKNQQVKQKTKKILKRGKKMLDIIRNDVNEMEGSLPSDSQSASVLVHEQPFAQGSTTKAEFKVANSKSGPFSKYFEDGCSVDCTEYLGEVSTQDDGVAIVRGSDLGQYYIHPRMIPSSRLDLLSRGYTHYYVEHIEVVYEPVVAATTAGALCIGIVEDPKLQFMQGEKGLRQLMETKNSVMCPVWQVQTLNYTMSNRTAPLVTRVGGSDMNLIFQGKIVVKSASHLPVGGDGISYGNLILKYRIHFYGNFLTELESTVTSYQNVPVVSASAGTYMAAQQLYFNFGDAGVSPTFASSTAYGTIVGIVCKEAFQCYIGGDTTTLITINAGRIVYARMRPSWIATYAAVGSIWLSLAEALVGSNLSCLTTTSSSGVTVATIDVDFIKLDYEYESLTETASKHVMGLGRQSGYNVDVGSASKQQAVKIYSVKIEVPKLTNLQSREGQASGNVESRPQANLLGTPQWAHYGK